MGEQRESNRKGTRGTHEDHDDDEGYIETLPEGDGEVHTGGEAFVGMGPEGQQSAFGRPWSGELDDDVHDIDNDTSGAGPIPSAAGGGQ